MRSTFLPKRRSESRVRSPMPASQLKCNPYGLCDSTSCRASATRARVLSQFRLMKDTERLVRDGGDCATDLVLFAGVVDDDSFSSSSFLSSFGGEGSNFTAPHPCFISAFSDRMDMMFQDSIKLFTLLESFVGLLTCDVTHFDRLYKSTD